MGLFDEPPEEMPPEEMPDFNEPGQILVQDTSAHERRTAALHFATNVSDGIENLLLNAQRILIFIETGSNNNVDSIENNTNGVDQPF